jgi:error-prone DNA polymerase
LFVELLARSSFSFLRGASQPEEVVARVCELGHSAVALCDRDGLYGSVRAHTQAKESGTRLIVGAELSLARATERVDRDDAWRPSRRGSRKGRDEASGLVAGDSPSVVLLARDHTGYTNLCRLLTHAHSGLPKGESLLEIDALAAHH